MVLAQCAWAANRSQETWRKMPYGRLAARRSKKRALVAVGRRLLAIIYDVLERFAFARSDKQPCLSLSVSDKQGCLSLRTLAKRSNEGAGLSGAGETPWT